jgi:hypothetical protein
MFKSLSSRLAVAASLTLAASGAMAVNLAIDTSNAANGLTDIYSATFDGALSPCGGGSPAYCAFFGGDAPVGRQIIVAPNPTGVDAGAPVAIGTPHTANGSFLDISLTAGNTVAQIVGASTISLPPINLTISGATSVNAAGAGFVILPSAAAPINGLGQVEFLVNNAPGLAADFTTLSSAVTSCAGPLCALIPILSLDMVRYRLFLDFDPTFTSFTGEFIGQTSNNSLVFATLNSAVIPVPAAVWLMGSALGLLAGLRRKVA